MNRLIRKNGDESAAYAEFVESYRLEEIGYAPESCAACYYTTLETANDSPMLEYTFNLMCGNCVSELVLTAAPTLSEASDFLRTEFGFYISAYPTVNIVDGENGKEYRASGKFGFKYNKFEENKLATMRMSDAEYDTYDDALEAAIKEITELLYKSAKSIDPIFDDKFIGSDAEF